MTKNHELSHLDESGRARMVDVGGKPETDRTAIARGQIVLAPATLALVRKGEAAAGNLITVAETAGIMAAKRTAELIPHCHPIPLSHIKVELELSDSLPGIVIEARTQTRASTGVEMEAMTAVAIAALTVYDMIKAVEPQARLTDLRLIEKTGGLGGTFRAEHGA